MNHDTQPGQRVETKVESFFKPLAYCLVLLRREGYPSVFYGDLYGTKGKYEEPPACGGKLADLILARKLYAHGDQDDYFDEANCIGFVRRGTWDKPYGLACVMSNGGPGQKKVWLETGLRRVDTANNWPSIDASGRHAQGRNLDRHSGLGAR